MAITNVKFLKENNLYEAHKQFMRIAEGYGYASIEEAGDEEGDAQNQNGGQDPMGGGAPDGGMGGQDPTGGQDPMAGGMGGDDPMGGQDPMGGGAPDGGMGGEDPLAGMPPMDDSSEGESDEDVIDVDDIVKAQEKTNDKVNNVGQDLGTVDKRIEKLLGALENMQGVIDKNNAEIASLKNEFQKRNPTQIEKLKLQSLNSFPFNINPTEFWKEKGETSNYSAEPADRPTSQEYVITNDDVDDLDSDIADTFTIPDDDIQDINKIFKF